MLAAKGPPGSGSAPEDRVPLVVSGEATIELSFWRGPRGSRPLIAVRGHSPPRARAVDEAARRVAAMGFDRVFTEAVDEKAALPFLETGFSVVEELVVLKRSVGRFSRVPRERTAKPLARIVPADPHRYQEIAGLDRRAFPEFWSLSPEGIEDAVRATRSAVVLVAEALAPAPDLHYPQGDPLLGYAILGIEGRTAYLQRLGVDPAWQRRGLGRALAISVMRLARRSTASVLWVNTPATNLGALTLYESLGFAPLGRPLLVLSMDLVRGSGMGDVI